MKVSFIIPAYNAGETVLRALDSIYRYAVSDFEVIVVDDKSTDDALSIVENCVAQVDKYPNLVLLKQDENHRQGAARNRGLKMAKGRYVHFVDADDEVLSGIWDALAFADNNNVDALFCKYKKIDLNGEVEICDIEDSLDNQLLGGKCFLEKHYSEWLCASPVVYLWKKDFLLDHGLFFIEDRRMEDIDWIEKCLYESSVIGCSRNLIYCAHAREGSTTHTVTPDTMADWIHLSYRRLMFISRIRTELPRFAEAVESYIQYRVQSILRYRNLTKFSYMENKAVLNLVGNQAIDNLRGMKWNFFTNCYLKYPHFMVFIVGLSYPFARLGRKIVNVIRSFTCAQFINDSKR